MLCMICGKTLRSGVSNETVCEMKGVEKKDIVFERKSCDELGT